MWSGVVLVLVSLVLGWVALWPARRQLGALAYHAVAFPTGLVAWTTMTAVMTLLHRAYDWLGVSLGLLTFVVLLLWIQGGRRQSPVIRPAPALWTYVGAAGLLFAFATVVAQTGLTMAAWDSIVHYEMPSFWLNDSGRLNRTVMASWAPMLPSVHSANRFLGGDWTYVVYPVLAAHVLLLFAMVCHRFALRALPPRPRLAMTLAATAALAILPPFALHTLYVHSHMVTALYLLLALAGLRHTLEEQGPARSAWLVVAGVGTAGLGLTRSDGLAYLFVPVAVAGVLLCSERWSKRETLRYVLTSMVFVALPYVTALDHYGLWRSRKLAGDQAAGMLLLMLGAGVLLVVLTRLPSLTERLTRRRVVWLLALINFTIFTVAFVNDMSRFREAVTNMVGNLLYAGGYGPLWWCLFGGIAVTVAFAEIRRASDFSFILALTLLQFFATALAVHSMSHPGRLHPADSFNRVAFHTLPLFLWYLTSFAGTAMSTIVRYGSIRDRVAVLRDVPVKAE